MIRVESTSELSSRRSEAELGFSGCASMLPRDGVRVSSTGRGDNECSARLSCAGVERVEAAGKQASEAAGEASGRPEEKHFELRPFRF